MKPLAAALLLALLAREATAAEDTLDPAVPTPRSVIGHEIGERHTDYAGVMRYAEALARAVPDRVRLVPIGTSWEGRPLVLLVVGSPANIARLDAIQAAMARLADPRGLSEREADALVRDTPAVSWDNFGVDGNESASVEAAMLLAYRLAASRGGEIQQALDSVVAVLNVCHNPESRERFVTWYEASRVGPRGTADPQALEHHGPWGMDSNYNHYQTDLNRDATWATQPETQAVVRAFSAWRPLTFVDHHGETENFFFPPVALPVNPNIPPESLKGQEDYGQAIAEAADRRGWSYFTGEVFDAFYPGYWDAYPLLRGAIGFTFETSGGGEGGLRVERDDRTEVTLRDGVDRHVEGALAVLRTTAAHREERLRAFLRFRRSAVEEGRHGPVRAYALVPGADPGRVAEIVATLLRHGIEVRRLTRELSVDGAHGDRAALPQRVRLPSGTWIVPLEQPERRLAQAMLEPRTPQQAEFVAEEARRRQRNLARGRDVAEEPPAFYDVTAWSLPLAYDVVAWGLPEAPPGEAVTAPPVVAGAVSGAPARAAYLVDPRTLASARLVLGLLAEGFKVAVSRGGFAAAGRDWPVGTFVVRTERNAVALHERMAVLGAESGATVTGVDTSWTGRGVDLGSPRLDSLRAPRIAVAADEPVSETAYGEVWFLLEQRLHQPFTALRAAEIAEADLRRYDVLVLPDGDPDEWLRTLGDDGIRRLTGWVRDGGVLICQGGAARLAAHRRVKWTSARPIGRDDDEADEESGGDDETDAFEPALPEDREKNTRRDAPEGTPGAIAAARVDPSHFLGYGLSEELPVLIASADAFSASTTGTTAVRLREQTPLLSGFAWPEAEERLKGAAWAIDEPLRAGHVIVLPESPLFRHFWRGTEKVFTNAILLAGAE